jgi:hypothetical protein
MIFLLSREKRKHSLDVQIAREDEFSGRLSNRANFRSSNQCCGSGSVGSICVWTSWIRILLLLFIFEKLPYVNVPLKSNKQNNFCSHEIFVGVLKVNDENDRIRIH